MTAEHGFFPSMTVPAVVIDLLLVALPDELKGMAGTLARQSLAHPAIAPHAEKRWGDVSEAEGNVIARECGLVARDAIARVHRSTSTRQ